MTKQTDMPPSAPFKNETYNYHPKFRWYVLMSEEREISRKLQALGEDGCGNPIWQDIKEVEYYG